MDLKGARWVYVKMKEISNNPSASSDFYRSRESNAVWGIHRIYNSRGSFLEVSKLSHGGKRQLMIMPSGLSFWGWQRFSNVLGNLMTGKTEATYRKGYDYGINARNWADGKRFNTRAPRQHFVRKVEVVGSRKQFQEKRWSETVIISKGKVNS